MNNNNPYDDPVQLARMLPERVAYFEFSGFYGGANIGEDVRQIGPVELKGLNVRFRVSQTAPTSHGGAHEAQFGICNLSRQMMANLANIYDVPKGEKADGNGYRRVQFIAGYNTRNPANPLQGEGLIFDGGIMKTDVSSTPPDVWFDFRAFITESVIVEDTLAPEKPVDFKTVVQWASLKCGFAPPHFSATKTLMLKNYRISGTTSKVIQDLRNAAAGGGMDILQKTLPGGKRMLLVCDRQKEGVICNGFGRRWLISENSGMIGVPEISFGHAIVTTVFNPHISTLDIVELKSSLMPYWNGVFWVARLEHYGELRGRDFCTKLELMKIME